MLKNFLIILLLAGYGSTVFSEEILTEKNLRNISIWVDTGIKEVSNKLYSYNKYVATNGIKSNTFDPAVELYPIHVWYLFDNGEDFDLNRDKKLKKMLIVFQRQMKKEMIILQDYFKNFPVVLSHFDVTFPVNFNKNHELDFYNQYGKYKYEATKSLFYTGNFYVYYIYYWFDYNPSGKIY